MPHPLMPKATAVWLVENTALTFEQIAEFCGLHELEVQAIADGEVAVGMQGLDPIASGELSQEELARGLGNSTIRLKMAKPTIPQPKARPKGARYTPVSKRQDRPDAIAWLLRNHPELTDAQISKLIGTTKPTINAIRTRAHWNMQNIKPQNPVGLGLCSATELDKAVTLAQNRARRRAALEAKVKAAEEKRQAAAAGQVAPQAGETPAPPSTAPTPTYPAPAVPAPTAVAPYEQPHVPATPEALKMTEEVFKAPADDTAAKTPESAPTPAPTPTDESKSD
jgi:hypothetical protein